MKLLLCERNRALAIIAWEKLRAVEPKSSMVATGYDRTHGLRLYRHGSARGELSGVAVYASQHSEFISDTVHMYLVCIDRE